ncbi:MAG: GspE/PulE family protein, partial [bacterium]
FKLLERNVVSIEDPVECQVDGINQIQVDEPRGLTFAEGIKATLRLDPDFMLVGEVRDHSSATAAVDAAVTGRTLMSTVHSRDAVGAVTVLRNFGLGDHEIASVLSMLVNQRLVRTLCPECRRRERPTEAEMRWLLAAELPIPESAWHPVGCDACHGLGFYGRTGVFEVWRVDEEDRVLLLDHAPESIIRRSLAAKDHRFLLTDALAKAEAGVTSISELKTMGGLGWRAPSPGTIGG